MTDCIGEYYTVNEQVHPVVSLPDGLLDSGTCLYEVVRVVSGKCLFPDDHLHRLSESVQLAGMVFHLPVEQAEAAIALAIESNRLNNGNLRLVWKEENGRPLLYVWPMPFSYPEAVQYKIGVKVSVFGHQRPNPNIKQYVTAYQQEMKAYIASRGVFEALLNDDAGNITEGSRTNVFFIRDDRLLTAPGDKVLKGITRGKVIGICSSLQIPCGETDIPPASLPGMDAVFLTGTSPKVLPVRSIDDTYYKVNHPLVLKLMDAYDRLAGISAV